MMFDAIVLAGSPNQGRLRECSQVENEALIPIGDRVMVDYVVAALVSSNYIKRVAVVGPAELASLYNEHPQIILAPSGRTAVESLKNGVAALNAEDMVLIATCDIPLLKTEAIEGFITACGQSEADLYYPIVSKEINEQYYPGVKRTYVHLQEGIFTGGNLFLFNPAVLPRCAAQGEALVELRKSPVKLGLQIGPLFIIKFMLRRLSLAEVEERFSKLLGLKGKAIILEYPEIGIDVDKPSDLELVRRVLA